MNAQYDDWIENNVINPRGMCYFYVRKMTAHFPELQLVKGIYTCPIWGKREHWWLVTKEGDVVDPTKRQFPSSGIGEYEEHVGVEPTGKCLECGGYCYQGRYFCSDDCENRFVFQI